MLPYWHFADRFGWPPSVVDEQSRIRMWAISHIDSVAEDLRRKQQSRSPSLDPQPNGRRR